MYVLDIKVNEDRCTNISTIEAGYEYENLAYKIKTKTKKNRKK